MMAGAFGSDGKAIKLARVADREIADVDHLLDFAQPFRQRLARLQRDQPAQRILVGTQGFAEPAHQFATDRRGRVAPDWKGAH